MSALRRELVFLTLQFLDEEKFNETVHTLEQESGFFFNMKYFEDEVQNGNWDDVEKYLSGFTKVDDNRYSMKIFFEIRKQKYLEALDKHDRSKAVEILVKDREVFSSFNEELFKEITQLLTLENFRENEQLSKYGDTKSARAIVLVELKKLIEANPLFHDKLQFPNLKNSRLRTLINQSLNWQHQLCKYPRPNPVIKTLFVDHSCGQPNGARAPSPANNPLLGPLPKAGGFPPLGAHGPFQPAPTPVPTQLSGWMSNPPQVSHPSVSGSASGSSMPGHLAESVESVGSISSVNGYSRNLSDVKQITTEESNNKSKIWKLTEISESSQCRSLKLPENMRVTKISRLMYTNSGNAILALASNAIHLLWKWQSNEGNSSGKATAGVSPQLWQPLSGILMTNDVLDMNPEESVSCFALSKNDSYVISASGGKISLFNMLTFKTMAMFMAPPAAATFLAFHPQDNNIIAIGMDDNTIQIYNVRVDEVKSKLKGHSKKITGLAFSHVLNVLVSSGADSQICVWSSDGWEKQKAKYLQFPQGRTVAAQSDTRVQFHQDQIHFLVVQETQLAIYETSKLECVKQWVQRESFAPISHATFSCDSQLVYACFLDATVCVFTASHLRLRCLINPLVYLSPSVLNNLNVHPMVIAAHPQESNQFALGLSDGMVHVFEPLESEGKWGVPPPVENGSTCNVAATSPTRGSGSEQGQFVTVYVKLNLKYS